MRTRWLHNLSIVKPCWICVLLPSALVHSSIENTFTRLGYRSISNPLRSETTAYARLCQEEWYLSWPEIMAEINRFELGNTAMVALIPGEECPTADEAELQQAQVQEISDSVTQIWLIDAFENNQLMCQFMPVVNKNSHVFGYESLVRARRNDGTIASGGDIFKASRILRIQHLVDKYLHELSIRSFAAQGLPGLLFINLLPGFIQRPEFYFGNLNAACNSTGMDSKRIVLECTNSENPRDIEHLKAILKFSREKGYLSSLDDIESLASVTRIFKEMRPDFIKLDMRLVQRIQQKQAFDTINEIIAFVLASGATLIAEGVENQEVQDILERTGVPLFQGYLYAALQPENNATNAA